MSATRKRYFAKLAARCAVFVLCIYFGINNPESFEILNGMNFFVEFSLLHLLWLVWMIDMLLQIIPTKNTVPLGSQKLFKNRFRPVSGDKNSQALKAYIKKSTKAAYKVFVLWTLLTVAIGALYYIGLLSKTALFIISVFFYVCDLICVLIWCPFRLMMKTRCCTTCRIFNWDHLMMFSPLIFVGGFYSVSLVVMAVLAWITWEISVLLYPERFWDGSNAAMKCAECTDKLCTQFCHR